jgi:hypothetical protein
MQTIIQVRPQAFILIAAPVIPMLLTPLPIVLTSFLAMPLSILLALLFYLISVLFSPYPHYYLPARFALDLQAITHRAAFTKGTAGFLNATPWTSFRRLHWYSWWGRNQSLPEYL